ncbi:hypothetical protein GKO46_13355 [SAR202 cluster bacterium JH702]|uniref:Bacterial Ig-like domain-containing protein n=1 Tax=Candidatus Lucifugimonas marina TaxID=3038979 RepID=A0ABD4XVJ5_9CHLR|nr:hypothetical protein [SAR202 cluster bacterium JH702]
MLNTRDRISSLRGNSAVAPVRPKVRSPRIRMVTPGASFKVGRDVFILVDALSDHETVGNLRVELLVDGATLISAKYSPLSGYYGAIWDSSSERSGSIHTIIAKVTDSVGNTKSTLTTVSVR